ncbi:DUF3291 domain-containing protein [Thalassotalea sp. 1_MG-2023]|uniref:DUF3291 domain-containing protein n=1 Tax=Thalassotalea sp. 1_MG-2023 TaxID=3062680 RepID=UPI0026E1A7AB|nr:DUF3291 domain-containing protein [Thalassotalea sp. 1_MG-2023]MDO6425379.1 DUF3291 domain-containing protein [Thalassotalea sp. 1_MG-2023]
MNLAQLNIAKAKYALDAPEIAEFINNLEPINAIAETSNGFVWRLKDDSGDATDIKVMDDPDIIVNMSVWQDIESLKNFMFRTHHIDFLKRKQEWFHRIPEDSYVLWWVPVNHIPTVEEAIERLMHLRKRGDSPYAFSFKSNFTAADLNKIN